MLHWATLPPPSPSLLLTRISLVQLHQHHEVSDDGSQDGGEQIQRDGKELGSGNGHRLLTLLADDLHERLGLLTAVVPVARVGGLHHGGALLNQPVAKDAEEEHLAQGVQQVAEG